jgi:hypothetical protein
MDAVLNKAGTPSELARSKRVKLGAGVDMRRWAVWISMNGLHFQEVDHSASWAVKVRNVSRLGSHLTL